MRTLARGANGDDVTVLQRFLAKAYTNFPASTGYFGPITEQAVQEWQSEHSVVSSGSPATTGWGVVGAKTRAAIAKACEKK